MATTEKHEHALTQKALDILTTGGKNPGTDGEESINFSVSRQGTPSDACLAFGDCTPFTPAGRRGILKGQPAGFTGQPMAYIDNFSSVTPTLNQLSITFEFDLNTGKVSLHGAFPGLPATLHFTVEYLKEFDGAGGKNIVFYSDKASDNAGYAIVRPPVGAS